MSEAGKGIGSRDTHPDTIRLWLEVTAPGCWMTATGSLWSRDIVTGHTPTPQDGLILWHADSDDPFVGPHWEERRRYYDADGLLHIELLPMLVDPSEQIEQIINQWVLNGRMLGKPWYTADVGDPLLKLERNWQRRS